MTRVQLHDHYVEHVKKLLKARNVQVQSGGRRGGSRLAATRFDLLTDDATIAVRVAKRSSFTWRVSVNGRRYVYHYRGHRWNLHSRGSTRLRPDVWILVAAAKSPRFFLVSGERVRGFYTLTLREQSRTWLLDCEDQWTTIRSSAPVGERSAA